MHEIGIAHNICEIALKCARENKAAWIKTVWLRAGLLRGIVPDQLQTAWKFVTLGSMADRSRLDIEIVPVEAECEECSKTFPVKDFKFKCSFCGSDSVRTVRGMELEMKNIELAF
jgi:hydrogenase nickel incorporation protein HypA/HybF